MLLPGVLGACSPRAVDKHDPALVQGGSVLLYAGRPFSGVRVERYPNGDLFSEAHFTAGRQDGETSEYAIGGKIQARWHFKAGVKDGEQLGWFIEGPRRFVSHFENGVLEGEQIEWHMNGSIFRRAVFADGVETQRKVLYAGKEIFNNYVIRDGRKYGIDQGSLCMETKREGEK